MKKNMGTVDRAIRIIIALIFIVLLITVHFSCVAAIILGVLAGVLIITSLIGFCPLYHPFGIHTLRTKSGPDD
ncbi:MAG: DUF2892 domain-containing protein [Bacteroidetes bacterium]|nr:DUF2892 domain-containing protein [Bacteroidota bacterium]